MPIYMIKYHNDYVLPHAYYDSQEAEAKMQQCITKEHQHFMAQGWRFTRKTIAEDYEIIEVQPDENLYEYGKELIEKEIIENNF